MKQNPILKDWTPKALLKPVIRPARKAFSASASPWTIRYLRTFAVHCTKGPAGRGECSPPQNQNVHLGNGLRWPVTYTEGTWGPQAGQGSTIQWHHKTGLQGTFFPTHTLRQSQSTQQGEKKLLPEGLVTNRNKPGLLTHHFNTAAAITEKHLYTQRGKRSPNAMVSAKERPNWGLLQLTLLQ